MCPWSRHDVVDRVREVLQTDHTVALVARHCLRILALVAVASSGKVLAVLAFVFHAAVVVMCLLLAKPGSALVWPFPDEFDSDTLQLLQTIAEDTVTFSRSSKALQSQLAATAKSVAGRDCAVSA